MNHHHHHHFILFFSLAVLVFLPFHNWIRSVHFQSAGKGWRILFSLSFLCTKHPNPILLTSICFRSLVANTKFTTKIFQILTRIPNIVWFEEVFLSKWNRAVKKRNRILDLKVFPFGVTCFIQFNLNNLSIRMENGNGNENRNRKVFKIKTIISVWQRKTTMSRKCFRFFWLVHSMPSLQSKNHNNPFWSRKKINHFKICRKYSTSAPQSNYHYLRERRTGTVCAPIASQLIKNTTAAASASSNAVRSKTLTQLNQQKVNIHNQLLSPSPLCVCLTWFSSLSSISSRTARE